MKLSILFSLIVALIPQFVFAANCEALKGCEAKICEIENNLTLAKTAGNSFKIAGLEKALKEAKANCTDTSLVKKNQAKIEEKMNDIKKIEKDLAVAKLEKNEKKIQKYTEKLKETNAELEKLKEETKK